MAQKVQIVYFLNFLWMAAQPSVGGLKNTIAFCNTVAIQSFANNEIQEVVASSEWQNLFSSYKNHIFIL